MEEGGEQHQKEDNTNRGPRRILQAIAPIIGPSCLRLEDIALSLNGNEGHATDLSACYCAHFSLFCQR